MDPDVLKFAQVMMVIAGFVGALTIPVAIIMVAVRLTKRLKSHAPASPLDEQRLARLEQTLDAIAIEVERISESQRFTAKLQAERGQEPPKLQS